MNVNWDHLLNRLVKAPFVPKVKDATDTSHIDPEFTSMQFESYNNGINSTENTNTSLYTGKHSYEFLLKKPRTILNHFLALIKYHFFFN